MWIPLALLSALFSALAATGEKKVLLDSSPLRFSARLSLLVLLLSIPFLLLIRLENLRILNIIVLYGKSVLGACAFLLVMQAIKKMELSSALPLLVLTPGLVALFAFLLLGEKLKTVEAAGMVLLLSGTYVLQLKRGAAVLEPFRFVRANKAYLFIFGALGIFTLTSILDKALLGKYRMPPQTFFFFQHLFLALNFGVAMLLFRDTSPENKKGNEHGGFEWAHWMPVLFVAVCTIIYRYSHILAVKSGPVALVLSLKRISVLLATVFGGRYLREHDLLRKGTATAVMLTGAALILLY